jgi:DnaK suppressor protein
MRVARSRRNSWRPLGGTLEPSPLLREFLESDESSPNDALPAFPYLGPPCGHHQLALLGKRLCEWPFDCLLPSMTATSCPDEELSRVQILLEALATELERGIHHREAIAIEQSPDQLDEIQTASDRDLAISKIDRQSKQLRNVRAALRRIGDGRFGICEQCDEDIAPKRLAAIPWASLCIVCQEAEELNLLKTRISADSLMSDAA